MSKMHWLRKIDNMKKYPVAYSKSSSIDANSDTVIAEVRDEDGAVYVDYKMIVEKVNGKQKPHRNN